MEKVRFTEAQIIGVLREQEPGGAKAEDCRHQGASVAAYQPHRTPDPAVRGRLRHLREPVNPMCLGDSTGRVRNGSPPVEGWSDNAVT